MEKPDLDAVFMAPAGDKPPAMADDMPPADADGDAEMDAALDGAIDDLFATDDPAARREAFKRAISLCKEGGY